MNYYYYSLLYVQFYEAFLLPVSFAVLLTWGIYWVVSFGINALLYYTNTMGSWWTTFGLIWSLGLGLFMLCWMRSFIAVVIERLEKKAKKKRSKK